MNRPEIDWGGIRRVLVVRLRSIGDTVLATPSLIALRRFLPDVEIDILLEDWVAPVLDGFEGVNVVSVGSGNAAKLKTSGYLRNRKYDVAINLHGGTTSSIFVRASSAKHRIGLSHYRYPRFYNHIYSSAADFWRRTDMHSAEQQLAVLGFAGIPVGDLPNRCGHSHAAGEIYLSHAAIAGPRTAICIDPSGGGVCDKAVGDREFCQNRRIFGRPRTRDSRCSGAARDRDLKKTCRSVHCSDSCV